LRIATFAIGATRTARHIIAAYRTQSYRKKTVFDVFAELAAANSTRESTQVLCDFPSFYQLAALSSCSISFQHHDREYRSTSIFAKSNFTLSARQLASAPNAPHLSQTGESITVEIAKVTFFKVQSRNFQIRRVLVRLSALAKKCGNRSWQLPTK
jgi:hypothetical protein